MLVQDIQTEKINLLRSNQLKIYLLTFISFLVGTSQSENIIPIPGTKKIKYLEENVKAVDLQLSNDDLEKIENILKKYPNVGPIS